jgi:hypothetical protein
MTVVGAMETDTGEPSSEPLWKWHLSLISIVLFLFGVTFLSFSDSELNDPYISDLPIDYDLQIDYDSRVPNIIAALPPCIVRYLM